MSAIGGRTDLPGGGDHGRQDGASRSSLKSTSCDAYDAVNLSKLFASAFVDDPLFDYMIRPGVRRAAALETFFHEILRARDIPQGEVWMSSDGHACVCWLSPDARRSPDGIVQKLSWLPFFVRVYSPARFTRGMAIMEAMEKNHPRDHHFY